MSQKRFLKELLGGISIDKVFRLQANLMQHFTDICKAKVLLLTRGGTEPGSARLGSARLVTIEEKSSIKARLELGSVTFGSWLGSARSQLAREPQTSQILLR